MRIVIASGKGGAGKTTVTACLAGQWERSCVLVDADVEAPNLHLLLHPVLENTEPVVLDVPEIIPERCNGCGECRAICSYGAIAMEGLGILASLPAAPSVAEADRLLGLLAELSANASA